MDPREMEIETEQESPLTDLDEDLFEEPIPWEVDDFGDIFEFDSEYSF